MAIPDVGKKSSELIKDIATANAKKEKPKNRWWNSKEWKRCGTCGYFGEKSTAAGRCRRHAPTLNGYPVVFSTDPGCGDHKPSGYVSA